MKRITKFCSIRMPLDLSKEVKAQVFLEEITLNAWVKDAIEIKLKTQKELKK